jgi:hypothetical protein
VKVDPAFERLDGGDPTDGDETHGRAVEDDEDERPWRPAGLRDAVDDPEIVACGLDAIAGRLPQACRGGRLARCGFSAHDSETARDRSRWRSGRRSISAQ